MEDKMSIGMFKRRVGKTPLLRAVELEKKLGVGEIYLKLEGTNPTGHKSDRIAHALLKDAMESDKDTLTIGTVGYLALSLGRLSEGTGVRCVFFVPKMTKKLEKMLADITTVEVVETGGNYETAVAESRRRAEENGWYDANPGLDNTVMAMVAYSSVADEIVYSIGEAPATISLSVASGSLLSGIHLGFRQAWSSGNSKKVPRIFGGSAEGQNAIVWAFTRGMKQMEPLSGGGRIRPPMDVLVNRKGIGGQQALDSLYDSRGRAYGMSENEMLALAGDLRTVENVHITPDSASALGAFIRAHQEGLVEDGKKHVIVLSTGKTDLSLHLLDRDSIEGGMDVLVDNLDRWLLRFTDPKDEIEEALENAFESGYVIGAFLDRQMVGVCVLSTMELDTFFQRYHMSYIAAEEGTKGRGVATQLFEYAIRVTNGDLSLHVETDNKKAIRLYKKMGMDVKYYRMVYKGSKEILEADDRIVRE